MTWSSLVTPPPARTSTPKHPLFTKKLSSTTSFGPGHLVGAGILVLGLYGVTKFFVGRAQQRGALAQRLTPPAAAPSELARADEGRGQYGSRR